MSRTSVTYTFSHIVVQNSDPTWGATVVFSIPGNPDLVVDVGPSQSATVNQVFSWTVPLAGTTPNIEYQIVPDGAPGITGTILSGTNFHNFAAGLNITTSGSSAVSCSASPSCGGGRYLSRAPFTDDTIYAIRSAPSGLVLNDSPGVGSKHSVYQYSEAAPRVFWQHWRMLDSGNGDFQIENLNDGECLDNNYSGTAQVQTGGCYSGGSSVTDWAFTNSTAVAGAFTITSAGSGLCLSFQGATAANAPLRAVPCSDNANQAFTIVPIGHDAFTGGIPKSDGGLGGLALTGANGTAGDTYQLIGSTKSCLDLRASSLSDGATIDEVTCNHTNAQRFRIFVPDSTRPATVLIVNAASSKCVQEAGTADGSGVVQDACSSASSQLWTKATNSTTGTVTFRNTESGKCLDIPYGAVANFTPIGVWACAGQSTLNWTPTPGGW